VQYGGEFFRTVPLTFDLWVRCVLIGASILLVGIAIRAAGKQVPKTWFGESAVANARQA